MLEDIKKVIGTAVFQQPETKVAIEPQRPAIYAPPFLC